MSWTYRVVRREHLNPDGTPCAEYGICEFYSSGGVTTPVDVVTFAEYGDDDPIGSLRWQLTEMTKALSKPILEWSEIV